MDFRCVQKSITLNDLERKNVYAVTGNLMFMGVKVTNDSKTSK